MIDQASPLARYSAVAIFFHWLTVLLIVVQFGIAWSMPDIGRGTLPIGLIGWHLSVGAAILAVTVVRLVWRFSHTPPGAPVDLPKSLAFVSRATHGVMYALLLTLPMLGWVNANARGWTVRLFGIFDLPYLITKGASWGMQMGDLHGNLAILLLVSIGLHVTGAGYHAVVLKDQTIRRML